MNIETERKFLIKLPAEGTVSYDKDLNITQTYLLRNDPDIQRRVRRIASGDVKYYYTEKKRLGGISREENEREITAAEYERLLTEADSSIAPVIKTRHILTYKGQRFEEDEYPFSKRYATIELELESEDQVIDLPGFIEVIKEVTGDPAYYNGALATNNCFPEESSVQK